MLMGLGSKRALKVLTSCTIVDADSRLFLIRMAVPSRLTKTLSASIPRISDGYVRACVSKVHR
mgnify:CR=1 FL=1